MKTLPIILGAESVLAILDGTKTQARKAMDPQPSVPYPYYDDFIAHHPRAWETDGDMWTPRSEVYPDPTFDPYRGEPVKCPFGVVGDRLFVQEVYQTGEGFTEPDSEAVCYQADGAVWTYWSVDGRLELLEEMAFKLDRDGSGSCRPNKWRPAAHMPRFASRITLEVTGVRVERLQSITIDGIEAEGAYRVFDDQDCERDTHLNRDACQAHWDKAHSEPGLRWEDSPWCFVCEFERVTS